MANQKKSRTRREETSRRRFQTQALLMLGQGSLKESGTSSTTEAMVLMELAAVAGETEALVLRTHMQSTAALRLLGDRSLHRWYRRRADFHFHRFHLCHPGRHRSKTTCASRRILPPA